MAECPSKSRHLANQAHQIQHPATSDVGTRMSAVLDDGIVIAARASRRASAKMFMRAGSKVPEGLSHSLANKLNCIL